MKSLKCISSQTIKQQSIIILSVSEKEILVGFVTSVVSLMTRVSERHFLLPLKYIEIHGVSNKNICQENYIKS